LINCPRKYILKSCAPKLDGIVERTTGKHVIRVESHCVNKMSMASGTSQQTTRVLVPNLDSEVSGSTGELISRGREIKGSNIKIFLNQLLIVDVSVNKLPLLRIRSI
jgi:hypothetical protein